MARTIRLGGEESNAPEPTEVYLFEHKYLLRRHTRSVEMGLNKVNKKLEEALREDDDSGDKVIAVFAEGLAVLLANNGVESPDPKKVIKDAWKADQLDLKQISDLYESLQEDAAEAPPT